MEILRKRGHMVVSDGNMNTGNLQRWRNLSLYRSVGNTFRTPKTPTANPTLPTYVSGWNGKSSARYSFCKFPKLVDMFEFSGGFHSEDGGFVDVGFRISGALLGVLANIPNRDIEPNDPEFAEHYGAQWGWPGKFLRFEEEVVILAPVSTGTAMPLLHLQTKPFFVREMTRLIRFGRTDIKSESEPPASEG